jgi:vitamin K-dependent gamma-carboxylase
MPVSLAQVARRLLSRCQEPWDAAGLAAMRALLGAVLFVSTLRFVWRGWVEELLLAPAFHFAYLGFGWVRPLPPVAMYGVFSAMALSALCLCVGLWPRRAAGTFCLLFTYIELIDQTTYLNHYYLVSLLTFLLALCPSALNAEFVPKSRWHLCGGRAAQVVVPAWCYWVLRTQVALVYVYAGVAKLNADWLFAAEPLGTWLHSFTDLPGVGSFAERRALAYGMSWAGAAFDLLVPLALLSRRSRPYAFATLVVFHAAIALLFPVGVFSWVMVAAATIFFSPQWPRRWCRRTPQASVVPQMRVVHFRWGNALLGVAMLHVLAQAALPLRHYLYPGDVNWSAEGFRFAWRVMLVETAGQVEFEVYSGDQLVARVVPRRELTRLQYAQMATQPDMILQYAHHVAARYRAEGFTAVRVYAQAWAALNGRRSQRLIEPAVDLAAEPQGLLPKPWIVPLAE